MKQIKLLQPKVNTYLNKDRIILKQIKKDKNIVYGAQAIKKHILFHGRATEDWDVFSKNPKKSAKKLERKLDRRSKSNVYYSKRSDYHTGTWKVYHKGKDNARGTKDDIGIADFTKPSSKPRSKKIDGIHYANLSESIKDKRKSIGNPQFAFRHSKDKNDLERIGAYKRLKQIMFGRVRI